ncbi:hypothetical protein HDU87_006289 [Geranomyces variabilis]|uniref:Wax synthase domain-containing protein n=1 Tax=Geranomyces variabilis TaxID=109894 RepID=A0AAD5XQN4_9FUNG|nr:hypothetical protein HDU87_006289 [Geranomyces variabilis]
MLSPVALAALNGVFLLALCRTSWVILLTRRRYNNVLLLVVAAVYLAQPLLFRHPRQPERLLFITIPWLHALRAVELARRPAFARRLARAGFKQFLAFEMVFVDRADPAVGPKDQVVERRNWRLTRSLLKGITFTILASFLAHLDITHIWATTAFLDPQRHAIAAAMGVALYLWMGCVADLVVGLAEPVVGIRMKDMFNNPFLATSLRSVWRGKWNSAFQEALENAVRVPSTDVEEGETDVKVDAETEYATASVSSQPPASLSLPPARPARTRASVPDIIAVFLLSGVFHDHVNHVAFGTTSLLTTAFFAAQAVGCLLEALLLPSARTSAMTIPRAVGGWLVAVAWLVLTAPWFLDPYIKAGGPVALPFCHVQLF